MTLSYEGNQLYNAIDLANDPLYLGLQDFKNYMTTYPGTEYRYNANGNLTDDANKGIVTIRSNWLNLPDTVQMENGDMASYTYSPSGDKFMCIYSTANTSTVTMPLGTTLSNGRPAGITVAQNLFMLYMDNVVYEGNPWSTTLHNLSKVLTDDGILVRTNSVTESTPVFERNYYVRDHLGNVRVVFDSQGRVRQLNNYTPFGMEYGESAGNQASVGYQDYKFGGKELDRRFELNWYNFGARFYDPSLGRFHTIDPLAADYDNLSPYGYCAGNPIKYIDVNGEFIGTIIGTFVGGVAGAYDSYKKGGDIWAGAAEGAVSGAIAGATVDLAVAATVATGGGALVVIGAGAAAGAIGGAAGAVTGDATGQVVTSVNKGSSISNAVSNINTTNMADKAKTGAVTGAIGGAAGGAVGKGLQAASNSTKAAQGTMSKNITETAKTLTKMGADEKTVGTAVNKITTGMGEAGRNTVNTTNKVAVGTGMATESAIKVGQMQKEEKK